MGGYKTLLNENEISKEEKYQKSGASFINFACPDVTVLREQRKQHELQCDKPGIIQSNIDTVAAIANSTAKRHTLCVDGKKITSGLLLLLKKQIS